MVDYIKEEYSPLENGIEYKEIKEEEISIAKTEIVQQDSEMSFLIPENENEIKVKEECLDDNSSDEAKSIWLRSSSPNPLHRQRNYLKSKAASENINLCRLQEEMLFLGRHVKNKESDEESQNIYQNTRSGTSDHNEKTNTDKDIKSANEHTNMEHQIVMMDSEESSHRTEDQSPIPVGEKINNKDDIIALLKCSIQQREERALQRAEERKRNDLHNLRDDPLYNFFLSMYQSTRNLPPIYQHNIKVKLFKAVSEAEADILKGNL